MEGSENWSPCENVCPFEDGAAKRRGRLSDNNQNNQNNDLEFWLSVVLTLIITPLLFLFLNCMGCIDCGCDCGQGFDCGNRHDIGRCAGCGDFSECGGYSIYRIVIKVGDQSYEEDIPDYKTDIPIYYPSAGEKYYEFLGYYDAQTGGTCYVANTGRRIKAFKNGMTLYGRYEEINADKEYELRFDRGNAPAGEFVVPSPIMVCVGQEIENFPSEREIEGYDFVGWYTAYEGGSQFYSDDGNFHLYGVGVDPSDEYAQRITLYARYTKKQYSVTLVEMLDGKSARAETVTVAHGDSPWTTAQEKIAKMITNQAGQYKFLGYSKISAPELNGSAELFDKTAFEALSITESTTIYLIKRTKVSITFHYTVAGEARSFVYEGFDGERVELRDIYDNGVPITQVVRQDGFNEGYTFDGWSTSTDSADGIEDDYEIFISKNGRKEYYACWRKDD